jgi:ribosomal-protein-alanine N-acetyltransferase
MNDDYQIMPAGLGDLQALRVLEKECFQLDAWPLIDLLVVLTFPHYTRFKATLNGEMVGFAAAEMNAEKNIGWIITIGVSPVHRRRGLARRLLHACEAKLKVPWMRLSVRKSNWSALRLYDEEGFIHIDTWKQYYVDGEDAFILEKKIQRAGSAS